jgi:hypothetical protein
MPDRTLRSGSEKLSLGERVYTFYEKMVGATGIEPVTPAV